MRIPPSLGYLLLLLCCGQACSEEPWSEKCRYTFAGWKGPPLGVHCSIPPRADADTSILIVIPGARRDADVYRDQWHALARAGSFIVLAIEGRLADFPSEDDYNAGGVLDAERHPRPEEEWLFSAIDPLFDDFVARFGSSQNMYALYGHSAGGGFVHRFALFKPRARCKRMVAANPAFTTMPDPNIDYPFGLRGAPLPDDALKTWFQAPLVLLLGDQDLGPRTKPLSTSPAAMAQGPHVFSRGLRFFTAASEESTARRLPLRWQLHIVPGVGHSNAQLAPQAVEYLFPQRSSRGLTGRAASAEPNSQPSQPARQDEP